MFLDPNFDSLINGLEKLINATNGYGGVEVSNYVHKDFNWSRITDELLQVMGINQLCEDSIISSLPFTL